MNQINERFTKLDRQELYERVWNTPASRLAKEFGISDVGLGTFTSALVSILDGRRLKRLDDECEARQRDAVRRIRDAALKRKEIAEQRRVRLLEDIANWKQAADIRSYLETIRKDVDAGATRIVDQAQFEAWFDWASWYADSIDPLRATPQRDEFIVSPTKRLTSELDLTRKGRRVVEQLAVQDTHQLFEVEQEAVQALCGQWNTKEWNEICRVLEGLGYPVTDRYRGYGC